MLTDAGFVTSGVNLRCNASNDLLRIKVVSTAPITSLEHHTAGPHRSAKRSDVRTLQRPPEQVPKISHIKIHVACYRVKDEFA